MKSPFAVFFRFNYMDPWLIKSSINSKLFGIRWVNIFIWVADKENTNNNHKGWTYEKSSRSYPFWIHHLLFFNQGDLEQFKQLLYNTIVIIYDLMNFCKHLIKEQNRIIKKTISNLLRLLQALLYTYNYIFHFMFQEKSDLSTIAIWIWKREKGERKRERKRENWQKYLV